MRRVNAWEMTQEEREALWAANDRAWAEAEAKKTDAERYAEWLEDIADYAESHRLICDE